MTTEVRLNLSEEKKHSGKYIVEGTEEDRYPIVFYLRREWLPKPLPRTVEMTIKAVD